MNILWVENHTKFATYAVRQFLVGHAVTVIPSLAEARVILTKDSFDLVLVDYDLDDGKGVEIVHLVRSLPQRLLIIATSAHDEGNRALIAAGADAVCGKLEFAQIAKVIAALVETGRG